MARTFVFNTSWGDFNGAIRTAVPLAMCCWARPTTMTADSYIMSINRFSGTWQPNNGFFGLSLGGHITSPTPDPLRAVTGASAGFSLATTTAGFTLDAWHHCAGIFASDTDRRALLNGGNKGTNTDNRVPSGLNKTFIARDQLVSGKGFDGDMAECGFWDLTDWGTTATERGDNFEKAVAAMAKGRLPIEFPLGLVAYIPLYGVESPEPDHHPRSMGSTSYPFTLTGSPAAANHAPVVPYSRRLWAASDPGPIVLNVTGGAAFASAFSVVGDAVSAETSGGAAFVSGFTADVGGTVTAEVGETDSVVEFLSAFNAVGFGLPAASEAHFRSRFQAIGGDLVSPRYRR